MHAVIAMNRRKKNTEWMKAFLFVVNIYFNNVRPCE